MNKVKAGWIGFLDHKNAEYWDQITCLAKLGYGGMEAGDSLLEGNAEENIARFQALGLDMLTVSADLAEIRAGNYLPILNRAKRLGSSNATVWACAVNASFWNKQPTYDACMSDIEAMEKAAGFFSGEGISLCYHNHFQDFSVCFDNIKFFDLLLLNTKTLKIEPDVGWVKNGGEDPVKLLERIAPRLSMSIHVKDWLPGEARTDGSGFNPVFTSVGNGVLVLADILGTARRLGVKWAVVEQDQMHNLNPVESLTAGYLNMKETGFAE